MATYLQIPVLRITKYHLLLQRYLKLLNKDSYEFVQVREALELMQQVNDQINRDMPDLVAVESSPNMPSSYNVQKLITLFGSILKQASYLVVFNFKAFLI